MTSTAKPPELNTRERSDKRRTIPFAMATGSLVAAYAYLLHSIYANVISPQFTYLGMYYFPPNYLDVALTVALATFLACLCLPRRISSASDFVLWTFFLIAGAPSILMAPYIGVFERGQALTVATWSSVAVLTVYVTYRAFPRFTFSAPAPKEALLLGSLIFTVVFNAILIRVAGASFSLSALDAVQDVRSSYKSIAQSVPGLGYGVQLQSTVINPIFMSLGIARNKWYLAFIGLVSQIFIYSVTGYKIVILAPAFILLLGLYFKFRRTATGTSLLAALVGAMIASSLFDALFASRLFVNIFVNRLLATPGLLTTAYFYVFDSIPKYGWSGTFLRGIVESPYRTSPGYYVGASFQNAKNTQANVSLIGDGFANMGVAGILIEAVFLGLVLGALATTARNVPLSIAAPSTMVAALGLTNTSAFTSVLTGGFGGLILAFALWPRESESRTSGSSAASNVSTEESGQSQGRSSRQRRYGRPRTRNRLEP